jgi:hypothetical protein
MTPAERLSFVAPWFALRKDPQDLGGAIESFKVANDLRCSFISLIDDPSQWSLGECAGVQQHVAPSRTGFLNYLFPNRHFTAGPSSRQLPGVR